jgi:hypothetical protein
LIDFPLAREKAVAVEWLHCSKMLGQAWVIPLLTDDGVRIAEFLLLSFVVFQCLDSTRNCNESE